MIRGGGVGQAFGVPPAPHALLQAFSRSSTILRGKIPECVNDLLLDLLDWLRAIYST